MKNPEISGQFPLLGRWFEEAKFVINIRDPRDTIASIVRVGEQHRKDGVQSEQALLGRNMYALSNFFKRYYVSTFDINSPIRDRTLFVRYEDVMTDAAKECQRLGDFCGLTFVDQKLQALGNEKTQSANLAPDIRKQDRLSGAFWSELYNKDLSTERIGKYAEKLSRNEISEIEKHCDDFNKVFGYW